MNKKRFVASFVALLILFSCAITPAAYAEGAVTPPEGLVMTKTATPLDGGAYKIRLETYTTGTVTSTTTTVPVDIVFVLDQSGSMAYSFDTTTRQAAMKTAVNAFIDEVYKKFDTANADHRMAIVTYGEDASTLQGWTFVDANGQSTLHSKVNSLPAQPSGATNAGAGMQRAETLMSSGYNYMGSNTQRQKVVVFFTDGVPTTQSSFSINVANNALKAAYNMKQSGVTLYSIGIFSGADPNQLYGATHNPLFGNSAICTGEVGSYWGGMNYSGDSEIPAANRFMNYVSTNFPAANEIGIEEEYWSYKITKNFTRAASSYYLTANNVASLKNIFQTISDNIQTADISLDGSTVVKDIISPYFTVPANTSDIKVYTAAYQGGNTWGADEASGLIPDIDGSTVSVSGFDFNANFITENAKEDGTKGSKLIIEFTVSPKAGFLGGNGVPTNGEESGVYNADNEPIGTFDVPTVDVPIEDVVVGALDKNVYLMMNALTDEACKEGATATCNGVNLFDESQYTGENAWKAAFVKIATEVKKPNGPLTVDGEYTITATVEPTNPGTVEKKTGSVKGKINVFKPELTYKDSEAYYGDNAPTDYSGNLVSTEWKHGEMVADENAMGAAPALDIGYTADASKLENGKYTKQDVPVKATVKIGTENVNEHTTFVHQDCTGKTCTLTEGYHFWIHIQTCTLTITKTGGADNESYVFEVRKGGDKYSEVAIWGNRGQVIYELPVGTYTIVEDGGWSWRYNGDNGGNGVTLSAENPNGTITCTNAHGDNYKWLNGFSTIVRNIFDQASTPATDTTGNN